MGNRNSSHNLELLPHAAESIHKTSPHKHKLSSLPENVLVLCDMLVDKSQQDLVGPNNISKRTFVKYFSSCDENFGELLYDHYLASQTVPARHYITRDTFLLVSEHILELRTDAQQLKYCLHLFARGKDQLSTACIENLVQTCYHLASDVSNCGDPNNLRGDVELLRAVTRSILKGSSSITVDALCNWVKKNCLNIIFGVHHWAAKRLLNSNARELDESLDRNRVETPAVKDSFGDSASTTLNPVLLWLLTCSLPLVFTKPRHNAPSLQRMLSGHLDPHTFIARLLNCFNPTRWTPLYNSREHGLSMNRFQHHVFSYRGPTVTLITAEENTTFCIATDQEWRDSAHHWGGDHTVLLQATPEYRVLETGSKMMYMNLSTRGHYHGIQVGLNHKCLSLEIDEEMAIVLVKKLPYTVLTVEVWGCAGEETKEAQVQQKRWETQDADRNRQVNRTAVDWNDHPDRYLLDLASSRPAAYGRRDSCS